MLTVGAFLARQRFAMHIRDHNMGIDRQLSLKGGCERLPHTGTDRTYIENLKDSCEVLLPRGDNVFIALRPEDPGGYSPFTLFNNLLLDHSNGSVIGTLLTGRLVYALLI